MGNQTERLYGNEQHWEYLSEDLQRINRPRIVRSADTNIIGDQYCFQLPVQRSWNAEKQIYYNRSSQKIENVVEVISAICNMNQYQCNGTQDCLKVRTEHIPIRLSSLNNLTMDEATYIIDQACRGFKQIFSYHSSPFSVNDQMIGLNQQAKVKVWINSNFGKNYTNEEEIKITSYRAMVEQILNCVYLRTENQQFQIYFQQLIEEKQFLTLDTVLTITQRYFRNKDKQITRQSLLRKVQGIINKKNKFTNNLIFENQITLRKQKIQSVQVVKQKSNIRIKTQPSRTFSYSCQPTFQKKQSVNVNTIQNKRGDNFKRKISPSPTIQEERIPKFVRNIQTRKNKNTDQIHYNYFNNQCLNYLKSNHSILNKSNPITFKPFKMCNFQQKLNKNYPINAPNRSNQINSLNLAKFQSINHPLKRNIPLTLREQKTISQRANDKLYLSKTPQDKSKHSNNPSGLTTHSFKTQPYSQKSVISLNKTVQHSYLNPTFKQNVANNPNNISKNQNRKMFKNISYQYQNNRKYAQNNKRYKNPSNTSIPLKQRNKYPELNHQINNNQINNKSFFITPLQANKSSTPTTKTSPFQMHTNVYSQILFIPSSNYKQFSLIPSYLSPKNNYNSNSKCLSFQHSPTRQNQNKLLKNTSYNPIYLPINEKKFINTKQEEFVESEQQSYQSQQMSQKIIKRQTITPLNICTKNGIFDQYSGKRQLTQIQSQYEKRFLIEKNSQKGNNFHNYDCNFEIKEDINGEQMVTQKEYETKISMIDCKNVNKMDGSFIYNMQQKQFKTKFEQVSFKPKQNNINLAKILHEVSGRKNKDIINIKTKKELNNNSQRFLKLSFSSSIKNTSQVQSYQKRELKQTIL